MYLGPPPELQSAVRSSRPKLYEHDLSPPPWLTCHVSVQSSRSDPSQTDKRLDTFGQRVPRLDENAPAALLPLFALLHPNRARPEQTLAARLRSSSEEGLAGRVPSACYAGPGFIPGKYIDVPTYSCWPATSDGSET